MARPIVIKEKCYACPNEIIVSRGYFAPHKDGDELCVGSNQPAPSAQDPEVERCPHGTVETENVRCRDCNRERALRSAPPPRSLGITRW